MKTRNKWTNEENEILVQAIIANSHNKAKAFREVATKINRSVPSIEQHWYTVLSNPENKHYVGCIFTLVGYDARLDNRLIVRENSHIKPTKNPEGLWFKLKKLLGLI